MARSISHNQNTLNYHIKGLSEFFAKRERNLYKLLKKQGVSDVEIARQLNISKQRVGQLYKEVK